MGRKPEQVSYAPNLFAFFFTQDDLDTVGGPRPAHRSRPDEVFIEGARLCWIFRSIYECT
jgi:hypothetical protein